MSRIGAHLNGVEQYLLNALARANNAAAANAKRIATGKKINSPSDDPAAWLTISKTEDRLSLVQAASARVSVASTIAAQTQKTLDQVKTQLDTIRTTLLTDETWSLSTSDRSSAQLKIDAALAEINTLAGTQINGRRLLDGSADFTYSGNNTAQIQDLQVYSTNGRTISGSVTATATQASRTYTGAGGKTTAAATFDLTGQRGSVAVTVSNGETLTNLAASINQYSHRTGITAAVAGNKVTLTTIDYGTAATLDVTVTSGSFTTVGTTAGTDATATINGRAYTGIGNRFEVNDNGLHFAVGFQAGFTGAFSTVTVNSARALRFALTTDVSQITTLGLPGVQIANFRDVSGTLDQLTTGGTLSGLNGNTSQAIRTVDEALSKLGIMQANVDGFANASVASSAALMSSFETTLTDSLARLNTVNDDEESLLLSKNQTLATNASAALAILQQQQNGLLAILQNIAGIR